MNKEYKTNIDPGSDSLKFHTVKVGFMALGRALQSASHFEEEVIKEISYWNEGFSFSMNVLPNGPALVMKKENIKMKFVGTSKKDDADLIVEIKNLDTAYRMITTQAGAHHVYAEHKIAVTGNVADSIRLIRLIYIIEGYLFPQILNKNILKKSPSMTLKKHLNRLHIYTIGMIFGK